MDINKEFTTDFKSISKNRKSLKRSSLYNSIKSGTAKSETVKVYSPQDVISTISKQIKAIQSADCVQSNKKSSTNINKYEKSTFVPVHLLSRCNEVPQNPGVFDTQCISDTQLINIIEDAEAMDYPKGVTQEFDTTFDHKVDGSGGAKKGCNVQTHLGCNIIDISLKEPNPNIINLNDSYTVEDNKEKVNCLSTFNIFKQEPANEPVEFNTASVDTEYLDIEYGKRIPEKSDAKILHLKENIQNNDVVNIGINTELKSIQSTEQKESIGEENDVNKIDELASSPIMDVKFTRKLPHLVYDLDYFEKYEKVAMPVIEHTPDKKTAKRLIDSQILGQELFINTDSEPLMSFHRGEVSPILKNIDLLSPIENHERSALKSDDSVANLVFDMKLHSLDFKTKNIHTIVNCETTPKDKITDMFIETDSNFKSTTCNPKDTSDVISKHFERDKEIIEDEILFSSDEEEEMRQNSQNSQELPLTCVLQTSFYDQTDVLDKTLFVGFQTASNKSIQICSESFSKAQNILDEIETELKNESTVTELVKAYDAFTSKNILLENIMDMNSSRQEDISKPEDYRISKQIFIDELTSSSSNLSEVTHLHTDKPKMASENLIDVFEKSEVKSEAKFEDFENSIIPIENTDISRNKSTDCANKRKYEGFYSASNKKIKHNDSDEQNYDDPDIAMPISQEFDTTIETKHIYTNNVIENIKNKITDTIAIDLYEPLETTKEIDPTEITKSSLHQKAIPRGSNAKAKVEELNVLINGIKHLENNKDDIFTKTSKNIKIKDDAIIREFEEVEMNTDLRNNIDCKYRKDCLGFRTASDKKIHISDTALAKSKDIFHDLNYEDSIKDSCEQTNQLGSHVNKHIKSPTTPSKTIVQDGTVMCAGDSSKQLLKFPKHENLQDCEEDLDKVFGDFSGYEPEEPPFYGFPVVNEQPNYMKDASEDKNFSISNHNDLTSLPGFETANKKHVTKEAMSKIRKLFQDIDNLDSTKFGNPVSPDKNVYKSLDIRSESFQGFQTASNKVIKVSDKAMARTKQMFQGIDNSDIDLIGIGKKTGLDSPTFRGIDDEDSDDIPSFQRSVSSKPIKISERALTRTKMILENVNKETKGNENVPSLKGFQTVNNKKEHIAESSLSRNRKLFQNLNDSEQEINYKANQPRNKPNNSTADIDLVEPTIKNFEGFKTASNKKVTVSEVALAKSRKLFQDLNNDGPKSYSNQHIGLNFNGFQTASNNKVLFTDEALANSRTIFKNLDFTQLKETNYVKQPSALKFEGFQTASNKKVQISKEALAKSKAMFQEFDKDDVKSCEGETEIKISKYQSENTTVSEKAQESKSKEIAQNFENEIAKNVDHCDSAINSKFQGFQTANNKKVLISEDALTKSRQLLDRIDANSAIAIEKPAFRGFQTASNKNVIVSEDALSKSRKMFQDIDSATSNQEIPKFDNREMQAKEHVNIKSQVFGFHTANNHVVKVSEQALENSKKLLKEIDNARDLKSKADPEHDKYINPETSINKVDNNLDNIINTQILNNFEETLYTEDFFKNTSPLRSKRSGSPILSCAKPKRVKKFEIPYSQKPKQDSPEDIKDVRKKSVTVLKFEADYKKIKQFSLNDLKKIEDGATKTNEKADPYILGFSFDNLLEFEFFGSRNDVTNVKLTINGLMQLFKDSVNEKLIPEGWLENHLKIILWKLISYEIKFPKTMKNICTARNVMEQLKYRYDKELYNAERPALRKIFEKDDTSLRTLILCVVSILTDGASAANTQTLEIVLTDGWYCIKASLDKMLTKLVNEGRIKVGTKIVTHGAELCGCEQGVSPWEDTSAIRLKLFGNSTRRARWDARLGYHGNGAILSQLSSVTPDGGKVARMRAFVARVYPCLYVERFSDGSTVTRSERLERLHEMKYESEREAILEKIYEEVEKEILEEDSQDSDEQRASLESGSQIAKAMKRSRDPAEFRVHLSSTQRCLLNEHTNKQRDKLLQDIEARVRERMKAHPCDVRNVVPLLKARVCSDDAAASRALLSVWKPNDAVLEIIKEGSWIEILNAVPTAVRNSELQISAGRQSIFNKLKRKESEKEQVFKSTLKRTCYAIKDLIKNPSLTTDYNEIDSVGMIFQIDPLNRDFDSNKNHFQNVYLTDADQNIICLNFWGGIKKFGFEYVLDTGQIVACMNLQKRIGNTRKNIPQYRVTEFTYFTKTPKSDTAHRMLEEMTKQFIGLDKNKFFDDCVNLKNNLSLLKVHNENISPYRFPNMDLSKNKVFIDSPLAQKKSDLNLTGLDFESTFKQKDTQELSPKTLLRKRQVNEKIEKLKIYGEPPPLSPIHILNISKNAGNPYKSPLSTGVSVAASKNILPNEEKIDIQCSPVLNRTYVKTKGNPVKLDFDGAVHENTNESIDHFAGDFEYSPPLSLD